MRNQTVTHRADAVFGALADPTRRAVLDLLQRGRQSAGEIARAFPVSRPAISRHLRILHGAALVRCAQHGRQRLYQLDPGPLKAVDHWVQPYRVFWDAKLAALKAFAESDDLATRVRIPRKRTRHPQ